MLGGTLKFEDTSQVNVEILGFSSYGKVENFFICDFNYLIWSILKL